MLGLSATSSISAQPTLPELAPPQVGKVSFCVKLQGKDEALSMRKFIYTLSGVNPSTSAADTFRLESGQTFYSAELDVTEPGVLKVDEASNVNFNCTFPIPPKTRTVELTIHSPPGLIQDCSIRTFPAKHACSP